MKKLFLILIIFTAIYYYYNKPVDKCTSLLTKSKNILDNYKYVNINNLIDIKYDIIGISNSSKNCQTTQQNNIKRYSTMAIANINTQIIEIFFEKYYPYTDSSIDTVLTKNITILNNKFKTIAKNYNNEITSFTPISTDKEIAQEYLINPAKVAIEEFKLSLIKDINNYYLNKIELLYKSFLDFAQTNYIYVELNGENLIDYRFNFNYDIKIKNNLKEKESFKNFTDEALNIIPIAGDIKDLMNISLIKSDANEQAALAKLDKIKTSIRNSALELLNNYSVTLKNNLFNKFKHYLK